MNQLFENAFKDVFSGTADSCRFQDGFEDAIAGKPAKKEDRNYLNGYSVGYEYSEKESAKCQLI
jgi:hypothetical protein